MLYSCGFGNFTSFKDSVEFELAAPKTVLGSVIRTTMSKWRAASSCLRTP